MITSIYASLLALLIVRLSLSVIKLRRKNRIIVGDGGNEELQLAIRTHANALEYIPITLLLFINARIKRSAENTYPYIGLHAVSWANISCCWSSRKESQEKSIRNADNDLSINCVGNIEYTILGVF